MNFFEVMLLLFKPLNLMETTYTYSTSKKVYNTYINSLTETELGEFADTKKKYRCFWFENKNPAAESPNKQNKTSIN